MKKLSSEKKIAANRENALRSTGPKSAHGKSKSKENAVKHGVYSTTRLLIGEDKELHRTIRTELRKKYLPQSYVEQALVACLIGELWSLRRILRAEQLLGSDVQRDVKEEAEDNEESSQADDSAVNPRPHTDAVYEELFLNEPSDRTQRIIMLKRHALSAILGIEKELDGRLRTRMRAIRKEDE